MLFSSEEVSRSETSFPEDRDVSDEIPSKLAQILLFC